jgi:hypothetical protein
MAYSEQEITSLFNIICKEISNGRSLRKVLKDNGMPNKNTFYKWVEEDEEKAEQYARAIEDRITLKFESIEEDYLEPPRVHSNGFIDPSWVQLQRLKIDAKKWELSKLMPKKYGDKLDLTSAGEKLKPLIIDWSGNYNANEETKGSSPDSSE